MKNLTQLLIALVFMFIISCSGSSDPQSQLKEIDELMNKGFGMTTEQSTDVNTLVEEGKRLLKEGKTKESSETLAKAIDILHLAQDAYIYNKAD